jgi:hypothetical protein
MSKTRGGSGGPRAVIHTRILDVARDNPDASLADIADEVSGANADLVDRVLSEYGDPGETETETEPEPEKTMSEDGHQTNGEAEGQETDDSGQHDPPSDPPTDPDELTDKQLQTVRAVYERTDATQGDIADRLGVTRATVSRRLNDIPGFEWSDRETFTSNLFDDTEFETDSPVGDGGTGAASANDVTTDDAETTDTTDAGPSLDGLESRLAAVEESVGTAESTADRPIRRELAHKVVHVAMESERITEEEELELIAALLD